MSARRHLIVTALVVIAACGGKTSTPPKHKGPFVPPPISPTTGCPEDMAPVPSPPVGDHEARADGSNSHATCIDRWEASLVDVFDDGHEEPHPPFLPVGSGAVRAVTLSGVMPQAYISRNEAELACRASKKRLCHEDEWVRACRGARNTTFPYGEERRPEVCNDQGRAPIQVLYGSRGAAAYGSSAIMNDPQLNQVPGTLAATGSHPQCKTTAGAFDMVGNLHEWIEDPEGTFVGGYYLDTTLNGNGCNYRTVAHGPSYHDYSTGFRCCADARTSH